MKIGNKGQAIALTVVAVGALAFLVSQIKGTASKVASAVLAVTTELGTTTEMDKAQPGLPKTVYGDPFSHPALPRTVGSKLPAEPTSSPKAEPSLQFKPMPGSLEFDPTGQGLPSTSGSEQSPTQAEQKGPLVCLQAIVSAPTPVAFLSFDAKDPQKFLTGQVLTKHASISAIRDGSIEIRLAKGSKTLRVGESIQL